MKIYLLFLLLTVASCQTAKISQETIASESFVPHHLDKMVASPSASGQKIAIASGGKFSSEAGRAILKDGGNVVDAAIAISFCLAVERPHSLGLGGGGFMTLHLPYTDQKDYFFDFRESAPMKASKNMYVDSKGNPIPYLSQIGVLSVGVPGFVAGLFEIHRRWGKLPWKSVLQPAILLATDGFPVYPTLADRIASEAEQLKTDSYTATILMPKGMPLKSGEVLIQKDLAQSLKLIALNGKKEFYQLSLAQKIFKRIAAQKGIITLKDLKDYQVIERKPIKAPFFGNEIITAPPPSAGGALLVQWANVLSGFDPKWLVEDKTRYLHLLAESMKRGYADRSQYFGDPDFTTEPWPNVIEEEYATEIRKNISLDTATPSSKIKPGTGFHETHGTTHLSLIDEEGNAIAATLSINDTFGARIAVPGTGIFLNNTMDDFSIRTGQPNVYGLLGGEANAIAPKKRPTSSMMPTILLKNGEPILSIGGAGGSRITSSVSQVILNYLLFFPNDLEKSQTSPRIHHQWIPDKLELENNGFDTGVQKLLIAKGHVIVPPPYLAKVQAVARNIETKIITAVADPRDDGAGAIAD